MHEIFWEMSATKQFLVPTDFHSSFFSKLMSMATINCSVTNILQNIFLYVSQKKETHTGLEQLIRVSKWSQDFHFLVNYPFKTLQHIKCTITVIHIKICHWLWLSSIMMLYWVYLNNRWMQSWQQTDFFDEHLYEPPACQCLSSTNAKICLILIPPC